MSSAEKHLALGVVAGIVAILGYKKAKREKITLEGVFASGLIGGLFGVLPDLLEPAISPNHRGFFHSVVMLALISGGNAGDRRLYGSQKPLIPIASAGYLSHLIADAFTPKSLPVI